MYFRFYFVLLLCCVSRSFSDDFIEKLTSIEWICANENCSEPIAIARPKQNYIADHKLKVSFSTDQTVNIYGKPSSKEDVWLVKIGKKAGVTPHYLLKESKVLVNLANCIKSKINVQSIIESLNGDISAPVIAPSRTHEVIDGTTIHVGDGYEDSDDVDIEVFAEEETQEDSENPSPASGSTTLNEVDTPEAPSDPAKVPSSQTLKDDSTSLGSKTPDLELIPNLTDPQKLEAPAGDQQATVSPSVDESSDKVDPSSSSSPFPDSSLETANFSEEVVRQNYETNHDQEKEISKNDSLSPEVAPSGTDLKNTNSINSDLNEQPLELPLEVNSTESSGNVHESLEEKPEILFYVPKSMAQSSGTAENVVAESETSPKVSATLPPSSGQPDPAPFSPYLNHAGYSFKSDHSEPHAASTDQGPLNNSSEPVLKVPSDVNQEALSLPDKIATSSETQDSKVSPDNLGQPVFANQYNTPSTDIQDVADTVNGTPPQDDQTNILLDTEDVASLPETLHTTSLPNDQSMLPPLSSATLDTTTSPLIQDSSPQILEDSTSLAGSQETTPAPYIEDSLPVTQSEDSFTEVSTTPDPLSSPELSTEESTDSPALTISATEDVLAESGNGWFSPIASVMKSVKDMFSNSDIGVDDSETINAFSTDSHSSFLQPKKERSNEYEDMNQSCDKDGLCITPPVNSEKGGAFYSIPGLEGSVSGASLIYVTITSAIVLLFSLGYYYIENLRRDTELIAKVNSLSAELFFAQKELSTMEEKISQTSENFQKLASNTTVNEEELYKLRQDLEESKAVNNGLELEIKRMEKEIEELVESNDEMHKMLTESITEEDRTQSLLANIADLKSVLSERLEEVTTLTHQLDQEKQQVELLTIALQKTEEQKEHVEEKLQKVQNEIESKALAVTKEFEEKVTSLEKIIEESSLERTNFEKELCELKAECEKLSAEKELSEKALKKAQGIGPGKALAEWLDTKEVRVELATAQKEVEKLRRELEEAKVHEAKLQEQKNELQAEIETLNNNYETAEKTKIETLTKLQVLSNYFKEKETQLQEELGEKEAQWLQKQSEDHTIYEQMRSLREENLSYKAQNEALKKEILDQEASFKIQIANEEQKSQENWVTLRHTERRLKEAQMEAAHLRSRLTALETNPDSLDDKHKSLELVNGEVGLVGPGSPPFMLYPPPHDFIPPPPLVSPSRPPPLGRLSSPPLTPPPPLSPYDLYPPPPSAPSPPTIRGPPLHKPHPRDPTHQRKQKESQSSNHSSESMEKPVRRAKR